ncbi:MAG: bifunctional 5,10-methylenetetrahydrofolate dehydrogenase/5,10-methenyltetrahydrofolate cyclohydrolase [Actinomycetota bacterium]|nr:bifunctional 5,10-methylenetetrahydrofolate dehydrogenase/5,10-methenyltetrahydrofolate cyclohydrolase [Actinomycetota bacterium]
MSAVVMHGAPVAEAVLAQVAEDVAKLAAEGVEVGLGTILVGDDPASAGYIRKKHEACAAAGIRSFHQGLPTTATQDEVMAAVTAFNDDPAVDAFLVQNPFPKGLDYNAAIAVVDPAKDADGLHPTNLGLLALGVTTAPLACTPAGIMAMLAHYEVPVEGRHVVVVGRGPTIGRPLSLLLSQKRPGANAAVTVVHTGVPDWTGHTRRADIVVGGAGVPNMIGPDHVRPGAAVVGAGLTWEGRRVLSDVDESVAEVAGWVTPRLGGVGPTTVAMLLANAVRAAQRRVAAG